MKKWLFTLSLTFIATVMVAQSDSINLDEVVITSMYKTHINGGGELKSAEISKLNYGQEPSNMFTKMPSVISLNDNGTEFGYGYFRIRGLDQTRINVSLDGCPWNEAEDFGSYFANSPDLLSSMSSVSVERGSSSMYNGIAGVAGGILLESVNLYKDTTSHVSLSTGSFDTYRGSVVYNMGNKNGWGLHIKATHQETAGYRDNSHNRSEAFTIKTGYKFNMNHSIDFLSMNGYHTNGQGWIGSTEEELTYNKTANGCLPTEDDEWFMTMNRIQYKGWLSNSTLLSSSVYYQYQTGAYRMDLDNYMIKMVDKNWTPTYALYNYGLTHHMYGANVLLKQNVSNFDFIGGINAYQYRRDHYLKESSLNIMPEEFYDNRGTKNDMSAFVQAKYTSNRLSLGANVQYRYVNFYYDDFKVPSNSFNASDYDTEWNFINYGFNVKYNIINGLNAFASYSHVNREPTRSDMFGGNETFMGLSTIESEKSNDVEAGLEYKSKYVDVSANYFYMWFDNELILNGEYGLNGLPCHENAKSSYRTGVELSAEVRPVNNLSFILNGAYSKNTVESETFGNKTHVLSPDLTLNADLQYSKNDWMVGLNFNYHSEMYVDMANEYKLPHLMTLNLYGELSLTDDIKVALRANNITNRVNYCTGAVGADGEMRYMQNAPANFNVSFNYIF